MTSRTASRPVWRSMPAISDPVVVSDVTELRELIQSRFDRAYRSKMLHPVPVWPSVPSRGVYLVEQAKGQTVLDIGCTGPISAQIKAAERGAGGSAIDGVPVTIKDCFELAGEKIVSLEVLP